MQREQQRGLKFLADCYRACKDRVHCSIWVRVPDSPDLRRCPANTKLLYEKYVLGSEH